jgi:uncharacterized membrane protein
MAKPQPVYLSRLTYCAILSQVFNGLACFALGGFMLWLHDHSDWKVMMMFSAVDSFFWGIVYLIFACCPGEFSLTVGTILGMCVGPVAVILGALLNWLVGEGGTHHYWYGYSLAIFGVCVFFVNLIASVNYRNTRCLGSDMDKVRPLVDDWNPEK